MSSIIGKTWISPRGSIGQGYITFDMTPGHPANTASPSLGIGPWGLKIWAGFAELGMHAVRREQLLKVRRISNLGRHLRTRVHDILLSLERCYAVVPLKGARFLQTLAKAICCCQGELLLIRTRDPCHSQHQSR